VTFGFARTRVSAERRVKHELRALSLMFSAQDIVKMGPNTAAFIEE
jgi:hypothetical protein